VSESVFPRFFHRQTYAEIDLGRLQSNFRTFRELLPEGTFICPMVKANAYGHGDVECARALRAVGARHLGVGLIEEGISLRLSGDLGSLLFFGVFQDESADAILEFDLTPVISSWHQLHALKASAQRRQVGQVKIHLKFNTGMNRLGFPVGEAEKLRKWIDENEMFRLDGLCTHLLRGADAGAPSGESESQLSVFAEAVRAFDGLDPALHGMQLHVLNSSATLNMWKRVSDKKNLTPGARWPIGARPGIGIYGVQPGQDEKFDTPLLPVMTFKSRLSMVHRLGTGERLSYNATWKATRPSVVGVVPAGYADGVMRVLSNKSKVLCRGHRAPIAGTVCMDYFMVDLTDVEAATKSAVGEIGPGEEIVLFGEQSGEKVTAQELADLAGTIPYEILTRISERVTRIYLK
jgi:alanine racemase